MKQMRNGNFFSQDHNPKVILKRIKLILGQGDWKIDYNISGSMINWVAEHEVKEQGPQ